MEGMIVAAACRGTILRVLLAAGRLLLFNPRSVSIEWMVVSRSTSCTIITSTRQTFGAAAAASVCLLCELNEQPTDKKWNGVELWAASGGSLNKPKRASERINE